MNYVLVTDEDWEWAQALTPKDYLWMLTLAADDIDIFTPSRLKALLWRACNEASMNVYSV